MILTGPIKIVIRWRTRDEEKIDRIRLRFGLPGYTTLNGFTPGYLHAKDRELVEECVRRGFLTFQEREWSVSGNVYSW